MAAVTSVFVLLLFTSVLGTVHGAKDCFADETKCLEDFRYILNDPDYFWFGNEFYRRCTERQPLFSTDTSCMNPSANTTLLSRLLPGYSPSLLQTIAGSTSLAQVTYSGESRAHFSCNHHFPGTARVPSGLRVDPLVTTKWGLAKMEKPPSVSWISASFGMKYTVLVLDVGYLFLHGVYINAENSMDNGQEVFAYIGPKEPFPSANPFLWVVLPQLNGDLDFDSVQQTVFRLLDSTDQLFSYSTFINTYFGFNQLAQSSMMLMNIQGDAYGAEYIKEMGRSDYCPYHVSMNPYLYRALLWAQLPPAWSHVARVTSPDAHDVPFLTSLNTTIEVTYNSDDITFESCCSQKTYIRSQMTPDPFKAPTEHTERPVQVRNTPRVKLIPMNPKRISAKATTYTLMMVDFGNDFQDFSADAPDDPAFIVHWMVANISRGDVDTGHLVIPYFGSNPFTRGGPRMYTFLLLEETKYYDPNTIKLYVKGDCPAFPLRCFYRVNRIMTDWGLTDIRGVTWYFAAQDAFARQRLYRTWGIFDKFTVCRDERGYSDPCPLNCEDVADQGSLTSPHMTFVVTMTLVAVMSLFRL